MNELAIGQENTVVISLDTNELIKAGVAGEYAQCVSKGTQRPRLVATGRR